MTAVNKELFVSSRSKNGLPDVFKGLVQAGGTQAIKKGEICCFNKTAGYWVPVSAVADYVYALAISREEQKAADLERFMEFYSLSPDDEFEIPIAAARALAVGDCFVLTVSDSQLLTFTSTEYPVARQVDHGHYPEVGATIRNRSVARVVFNPACTFWGLIKTGLYWGTPKPVVKIAAFTLYEEMSGLTIFNTGDTDGAIHVLPQTPKAGTWFKVMNLAAYAHGFEPGAGGAIIIEGAKQTDDKYVTIDDEGDSLKVMADENGDWVGEACISSAADATGAIDVEGG